MPKADELSPAHWAYLGDALYEVYVREQLVRDPAYRNTGELHREAIKYVRAEAQARIVSYITPRLTAEERELIRKGRNQKCGHIPAHTNAVTYRYSTAWESLLGYLYLTGRKERMAELMAAGFAYLKAEQERATPQAGSKPKAARQEGETWK
ncbi:MAG TPA: Mini-ribonuclease 3 [Firmicutes bacterium]|uniref:Mini-ribonuclease 3 n=1 Tax=Capillibacterium thermochitinicola TaxID=2699427 RepID=A0A8J6I069_9FIRM|nr:ribonuclease III domain-containing protein [Capillibacterium thermochitinicola]MBA2132853.1 Mini-ribonuclease 3 [Capillibacterium thermochitinicola]HHW13125.1 Mini-ribonuclease 3 [Bacillota bacterium]